MSISKCSTISGIGEGGGSVGVVVSFVVLCADGEQTALDVFVWNMPKQTYSLQ